MTLFRLRYHESHIKTNKNKINYSYFFCFITVELITAIKIAFKNTQKNSIEF